MSDIRVATFEGPGAPAVIRMVDRPRIGRRAALFAIGACGVSDTDLRILNGQWPDKLPWPLTPGHEAAGVLEELGGDLTEDSLGNRLKPGNKILVPKLMPCTRCPVCLHHPAHAARCLAPVHLGRSVGFDQAPHLWGGWAGTGHVDLGANPGARLYRLPDDMPLWLASLAEPFTTGLRALRRAQEIGGFPPGASVVVHGTGPVALLTVAAALELGAGRVIVAGGPEDPFLRLCRQFGAEATIGADSPEESIEIVRETVGGLGADLVMNHGGATADALAMLRDGGTCVDLGSSSVGLAADFAVRDLILIGSGGHAPGDLVGGIQVLYRARGRYPFLKMLTRFPLTASGIADALTAAADGRAVKAALVPNPDIIG